MHRKGIDTVKRISILILAMCMLSGMASAAPSFYGTTGLIYVPTDGHLQAGGFSANFHSVDTAGDNLDVLGANVGLTDSLEIGVARLDFGDGQETILNGKYSILEETASRPSFLIGVLDAGGNLDADDDPGFYLVLGKNLTSVAASVSGEPMRPIRGYLGIGTGFFDGLFAGAEWSFSDKATLMAEFVDAGDSTFNAGVRFAISGGVRADLAFIDAEDLGFGISYTKLGL